MDAPASYMYLLVTMAEGMPYTGRHGWRDAPTSCILIAMAKGMPLQVIYWSLPCVVTAMRGWTDAPASCLVSGEP